MWGADRVMLVMVIWLCELKPTAVVVVVVMVVVAVGSCRWPSVVEASMYHLVPSIGLVELLRETKVRQYNVAISLHQNVLRLEVSEYDIAVVEVFQPQENLHRVELHLLLVEFLEFVNLGKVRSGRVGSGRGGSGQVGSGRVGSGRVGSGRVGPGRVGSGRVGSGRVRCGIDAG